MARIRKTDSNPPTLHHPSGIRFRALYFRIIPDLKVIFVSVPLEITLQRMRSRRREAENEQSFQRRLHRAEANQTLKDSDFIIDDSGSLDVSANKLLSYLLTFCQRCF